MMKRLFSVAAVLAACIGLGNAAQAASVVIDSAGGAVQIRSKDMAADVFGGFTNPVFNTDVLASIHDDIDTYGAADITTDNMITVVALETSHGLTLVNLVDQQLNSADRPTFSTHDAEIGFQSSANYSAVGWINDEGGDIEEDRDETSEALDNRTFTGLFTWQSEGYGDGFAWSNLATDDFIETTFRDPSSLFSEIQFLSWDGQQWSTAGSKDRSGEILGYNATVAPTPAAFAAGLPALALLGLGYGLRRRRQA
ncbi:MAG: hypothetical protein ACLFV3_11230 [Phycisphaeraceae bacterium]